MAIQKKPRKPVGIPTASMADISFLLLLFFMVSTVFVKEKGLKITYAKAKTIEKIPRNNAATIYIDRAGRISIDDYIASVPDVQNIMMKKYSENYNIIASFRTDSRTEYGVMSDVMGQLRKANTLKVSFEAKLKR